MMGSRDSEGAERTGETSGCAAAPSRTFTRGRGLRATLALLALVVAALIVVSPALGDEPTHSLLAGVQGHIKATKVCPLNEPLGIAVNEKTGDIYVTDEIASGKHHVEHFNANGECVKAWAVADAEQIAVDNSTNPADEDRGDVYVTGATENESEEANKVRRYNPEGELLHSFNKYQSNVPEPKEPKEFEELFELKGIGVDSNGNLWVYEPFEILKFNPDATNTYTFEKVEPSLECEPMPGFAVTANSEFFYVGHSRELKNETCQIPESTPAMVKLDASTGEPAELLHELSSYNAQLDAGPTRGVAVNQSTGTVYFDDESSVAAFDSEGKFLQRFGYKESEALSLARGVAVDAATNDVYVPEAINHQIDVFGPAAPPPPAKILPPLPDGRTAELVSPAEKNHGSSIIANENEGGLIRAAEDGSAITYLSNSPLEEIAPDNRAPEPSVNLSRRNSEGAWTTQDLGTPRTKPLGWVPNLGSEYRYFSSDLSTALVEPMTGLEEKDEPPLAPVSSETTLYSRDISGPPGSCEPVPSSCYQPLVSSLDPDASEYGARLHLIDATPDARHAVFLAKGPLQLTGEPVEGKEPLFEWNAGEGGGTLQRVNVAPADEPGAGEGAKLGEDTLGDPFPTVETSTGYRNAISNDGSRVIWAAEHQNEFALYMRDMVKQETLRLDTREAGMPAPQVEPSAIFRIASTDGKRIFFTDEQPLLKESTSEEETESLEGQADLYECEVVEREGKLACNLTDLTTTTAAPNEAATVLNVVGASEDGTTIYYVANGDLAPGADRGHCGALSETVEERPGKTVCNLYVQHRGSKGWEAPRFVARLSFLDFPDWNPARKGMTTRVSPNGEYAAFMSSSSLTGYNNHDVNPLAGGAPDEEVYLYSRAANTVTCVSCNPSGKQPQGVRDQALSGEGNGLAIDRPLMWQGQWLAGDIGGFTTDDNNSGLYYARNLDDSGRLFFNSADPLVEGMATPTRPEQVGEGPPTQVGVTNVYEYEPQSVGSCTSATGCISLLTGGDTPHESEFFEASLTGEDVFVWTTSQLEPAADKDGAYDVYDLQVCRTGAPCAPEPAPVISSECSVHPAEPTCKGPSGEVPASPPKPPTTEGGSGNSGTVVVLPYHVIVPPKQTTVQSLTNAQKLAKALKECRKKKNKKKRQACERQARKHYPVKKAKKAARKARRARR